MEAVIRAEEIGVWYKNTKRTDVRSLVLELLHGRRQRSNRIWAVEGVSFAADAAEVLGIIGANGAGKTTICSVIAKVLRPDSGTMAVRGEVSALLSMGAGFNQELTGRENIALNGLMLGFSRRRMRDLTPEIIAFAGIERFLDTPVKHYSAGMRSRLGFSIAAMLNPEILVLDEVLSAGDVEFSARATERMRELVGGARMVVVVSHSMAFVAQACDRAIWIDEGRIRAEGPAADVVEQYKASVAPAASRQIVMPTYEAPETTVTDRTVARVENLGVRFTVNRKPFHALEGVTFSVRHGEILGVIGHNGAGKTTLCRALTRIYRPDTGRVETNNRVSALLSMGTGFNQQLDAADNIMLNGLMLGMSRRRMRELTDRVIAFAELEAHRHKPVKHYSSGMKSRLAFSIAVAVDPALLLVDEALSAGDLAFKQKATEAMDEMIRRAEAVILVSHNLEFVKSVCTRAIWLDHGRLEFDGAPDEAVGRYQARAKARRDGRG